MGRTKGIRVIMLDLVDTLTDGQRLFPHVPDCLEALADFVAADGKTVELCLVSDFKLADPFTEAESRRDLTSISRFPIASGSGPTSNQSSVG